MLHRVRRQPAAAGCARLDGGRPEHHAIGSVTADGAYDTRKCHDAIADRGAYAVIPARKNKALEDHCCWSRGAQRGLRASRSLGHILRQRSSGYHRRNRFEMKMHCVKLLGQRLMARDFDRLIAELEVRITVLNAYTALGIPVIEAVG
ncbi:MAG: hypothetical protein CMN19_13240 [Roseovarius sp.]|nr:hypothetical protein [Roseovarius sp.]